MRCSRIITIILCFCTAIALFGCNSENHVPSESAAVTKPTLHCEVLPAVPVTEPILFDECSSAPDTRLSEAIAAHNHTVSYSPQRPWSVDDWVVTTVEETISWVDSVGNHNVVTVRLPHLCSGNPFAYEYNSSIDEFGSQIVAELEECAEGSFSTHLVDVDYEAWLNGDTLSILITIRTAVDYTEYRVDNFDLDKGEAMSTAEMCDVYLDMEYPQFLKLTHEMILRDFEAEYGDFTAQFPEDAAFIRELFETDAFVVRNRSLFLGDDGKLMMICDRPSVAGAAYYPFIEEIKIDESLIPSETDAWNWLFDLYLGADQDNSDIAGIILCTAHDADEEGFEEALHTRPRNEQEAIVAAIHVKYNSKG